MLPLLLTACGLTQATSTPPPTATPLRLAASPAPSPTPSPTATATTTPTRAPASPTPAPRTATPTAATAAVTPAATRAATATRPAATTTRPGATATRTPAGGAGGATDSLVIDQDQLCEMALPAGITKDADAPDDFTLGDSDGFGFITSTTATSGRTLTTASDGLVQGFSAVVTDYKETNRVTTSDSVRVDFTGTLVRPAEGTLFTKQFGTTICAFVVLFYETATVPIGPSVDAMIAAIRPRR